MRRFPLAIVLSAVLVWPAALWSQQSAATGSAQSGTGDAPRSAVPANAAKNPGNAADSKTAEKNRQDQSYIDPNEPLFAPGPLPKGTVSLVGGTVESLDRIRNRIKLRVTAGGKMTLAYDERTRIFRDGHPITYDKIRKGDRVYVDTMLNDGRIFARNIRVQSQPSAADARGQIIAYDRASGSMTVQDELSSEPVTFRITPDTTVRTPTGIAETSDLMTGSLVSVQFLAGRDQRGFGVAREVAIVARPGSSFLFAGTVTYLDLHRGTLSVANKTDNRTYDITFDPASLPAIESLRIGSEVTITAVFDGKGYRAREITVSPSQTAQQ